MANYRKKSAIVTTSGATSALAIEIDPNTLQPMEVASETAEWFTLPYISDSSINNSVADVTVSGEDDEAIVLRGTRTVTMSMTFLQNDAEVKNLAYDLAGKTFRILKLSHNIPVEDKWEWLVVGSATFSPNVTHNAKGGTIQYTLNISNNSSEIVMDWTTSGLDDTILEAAGIEKGARDSIIAEDTTTMPANRAFYFFNTDVVAPSED